jgi:hypothetical protein
MGYSMLHRPDQCAGIEADSALVDAWNRLVVLGPEGVQALVDSWMREDFVDDPLCSLLSRRPALFAKGKGCAITDGWSRIHLPLVSRYICGVLPYASTIDYRLGDYRGAPDIEATWFIDPPYEHVGAGGYSLGSGGIDYGELADWCLSRRGLVIVCEGPDADWLPFESIGSVVGIGGSVKPEYVWVRDNE